MGYEGHYEVSDQGRVRSLARTDVRGKKWKPRILKLQYERYVRVSLKKNGSSARELVHRIVAKAFLGEPPENRGYVLHLNNDPHDNRPSNLRWGTHTENMRHRIESGNNPELNKTHCPQGHPYDEKNTYVDPKGHRRCRKCGNQRMKKTRVIHGSKKMYFSGCRCAVCDTGYKSNLIWTGISS